MKIKAYIRIGKTKRKYKVMASEKPNFEPIKDSGYSPISFYPTIFFGIEFNLPDEAFEYAEKMIGEIDYRKSEIKMADNISKNIIIEIKKSAMDNLKK